MPDLDFHIEGAQTLPFAAVPTLCFKLAIENQSADSIRSVLLRIQIQLVTVQRHYSDEERARLFELFGQPHRWGDTLKSILWTQTIVAVPPFQDKTAVDVPVTCTYDFEVVSAKYFHALEDGEIPLEFLFSGTVFYSGGTGLQVAQIPWEKESSFRLPVRLWQETMAHYFPNSAWLRLRQDLFDRFWQYKMRQGLPTWEAALERLLQASEAEVEE